MCIILELHVDRLSFDMVQMYLETGNLVFEALGVLSLTCNTCAHFL